VREPLYPTSGLLSALARAACALLATSTVLAARREPLRLRRRARRIYGADRRHALPQPDLLAHVLAREGSCGAPSCSAIAATTSNRARTAWPASASPTATATARAGQAGATWICDDLTGALAVLDRVR
jgi:hypothetical protein